MQRIMRTDNDNGVVMMETIITLPLYLILLFGLFVLGDYCLMRLKLNNAERVRHWEMGLRYTFPNIRENDLFTIFASDDSGMVGSSRGLAVASRNVTSSSLSWGQKIVSAWRVGVAPSNWAAGGSRFIINKLWAFSNRTDNPYGEITDKFMYARSRNVGTTTVSIPTLTISRRAINNRNSTYQGNWFGIFSESYNPDGSAPIRIVDERGNTIDGISIVRGYGARNAAYVAWSE